MGEYYQYAFSCSVTILPCHDEVFLLLFTEDTNIQKMFDNMEEIIEYPYWDNTDQPDGMTWEEWEARGEEWDEAIGDGVPAQNGFDITILKDVLYVKIYRRTQNDSEREPLVETLKYIPDTDKRVDRLVRMSMRQTWKEYDRETIDELLASDKGEYAKWKESDNLYKTWCENNQEFKESERLRISSLIKTDFTEEDLMMTVEQFIEKFGIEKDEEIERV